MAPRQRPANKRHSQRGVAAKSLRPSNGPTPAHQSPSQNHVHETKSSQCMQFSTGLQVCWYCTIFLLAVLCYANTLNHDLVHDDIFAIKNNHDVHGYMPLFNLLIDDFWGKPMWDNTSHKSYRPLCVATFRLNFIIHGLRPFGYHLMNTILHAVVSVLFAYICHTIVFNDVLPAVVAAVLFAAHPVHTEAVAGVVGRADMLACLFFLLSFLVYERSIRQGKSGFAVTTHPAGLVLVILLAVCSLLSKEHGATVLGVIVAYDIMVTSRPGVFRVLLTRRFGKGGIPLLKRCAVVIATVIILLVLRVWMLQGHLPHFSEQDNPASFAPQLSTRFLTYSYLVFFNAWLLVCPTTLSYDWQMNSIPLVESLWDIRNLATIATFVTLGAISVAILIARKEDERRILAVGLLFLVISFLPASNLFIRVGFVVAERILYIPSLGFCILCAHGLTKLKGVSSKYGTAIVALLVALLTVLYIGKTVSRNQVWKTRESLFRSGLETLPHNGKMHYNYANFLMDTGRRQEAIHHYQRSLRLWPEHASANNNLGTLLKNEPEQAEAHYRQALRINPDHVRAHFNLANHLSKNGRLDEAEQLFRRAIHLDPEFADVHINLASLLEGKGQLIEAEQLYLNAVTLQPKNGDYCNNYGAFLTNTGRYEDAYVQYQECLQLQPNHTVTIGNQARLLRRLGKTRQSEELFLRALSIERHAGLLASLGALYFNTDRPERSHDVYREAVQLNPMDAETRTHYAQVLASLGHISQAIEELLVAVSIDAEFTEAHRQLASIYILAKQYKEGLKHATMALQLDPNAEASKKANLLFEIGNCLKEFNKHQEALQSYQEAVKLDPKHNSAHLNLGALLHLKGDYTNARRHYQEALKLDPDNRTLLQNIAKLDRVEQRLKKRGINR